MRMAVRHREPVRLDQMLQHVLRNIRHRIERRIVHAIAFE
jgi:hypothetical protein